MIHRAEWREQFNRRVMPRLAAAHPDLTRIADILRDETAAEVWTETPSDPSKVGAGMSVYSLEGWRIFYGAERAALAAFNTASGTLLQGYDGQAKVALDGYLASIPAIGAVMGTIMANYRDAGGNLIQTKVSQAHRDQLAAAIEAQLQG